MNSAHLRIFIWIGLLLCIVELGLEVRAMSRGWDTMLFGTVEAGDKEILSEQSEPEFGPTKGFPFRSRIVPRERKSGNHRYWIASSSHAEDRYLPKTVIFPVVLERYLKEKGVEATVLNASRAGTDIASNIEDLKRWGEQWKPDYVILYQMSLTISTIAKRTLIGGRVRGVLSSPLQNTASRWTDGISKFVEHTTIFANMKGQVSARIGESRVLANDLGIQGEREFVEMLHDFISTTREMGSLPVLATFATSHTRQHLVDFPKDIALALFKYSSLLSVEGWVASVERFNSVTRRIAAEEGLPLVDVAGAVGGHPELFRDFVHFTPAGHEAVARVMAETMLRLGSESAQAVKIEGERSL